MRKFLKRLHPGDASYIRWTAFGPAPPHQRIDCWVGSVYIQQVIGTYLRSREKEHFDSASKSQVRYFLLLVAEDIDYFTRTTS